MAVVPAQDVGVAVSGCTAVSHVEGNADACAILLSLNISRASMTAASGRSGCRYPRRGRHRLPPKDEAIPLEIGRFLLAPIT